MRPAASGAQAYVHFCDARSGRGDDPRRPHCRHAGRRDRAGRLADGNLFKTRELLRRRFLRLAFDESRCRRRGARKRRHAFSLGAVRHSATGAIEVGRPRQGNPGNPARACPGQRRRQVRGRPACAPRRTARQGHFALFRGGRRAPVRCGERGLEHGRHENRRAADGFPGRAAHAFVRRPGTQRERAVKRAFHTPGELMDYREKSEIRDGMRIDWDMPIKMDDGIVLRCDIYRPVAEGKYPVIMTLGPYGKWLHFEDLYKTQWDRMCADHPDVPTDSTNKYQCWEVVDPEKWVPDGYVCIRVDSRGAGRSPGVIDIWSLREAQDLACCIEWAGTQPWSNGKVGLNGISYYAQNQWQTSALQPKHLAAICTWEGAADFYRDMAHHGGIFNRGFVQDWSKAQVYSVQNGRGTRGFKSRMNGDWVSGPETLSEEQLGQNRRDFYEDCISRKLDTDPFWQSRMPDWTRVKTP